MKTRYWMAPTDIMDEDRPLRDTDIVDRLNEQDEDITILRSQRAELLSACNYVNHVLARRNMAGWEQSMRDIIQHALGASVKEELP